MAEKLTDSEWALLRKLAPCKGVIWLRGTEATVAIRMGETQLVALGPTTDTGAVPVWITPAGRLALNPSKTEETGE